jgi:low affinity Fe/Cu permease
MGGWNKCRAPRLLPVIALEEPGMNRIFTWFAGRAAFASGQPLAFVVAAGLILVWGMTGPIFHYSDTWQLVINTTTTIVTFLMVFLIQNSQNRDGAAIQAKLDELLRAVGKARPDFIGIEHLTDTEIEKIRVALERETGNAGTARKPAGPKPKPKAKTRQIAGKAATRKAKGKAGTADESVDRLIERF